MTREEDIKARLAEEFVHWIADDRDFDYKVAGDSAEPDLRYLLARNEELQRRVEKMQAVVDVARKLPSHIPLAIENTKLSASILEIKSRIKALYAKE